jgi:uncharacterized damage-inducible protein DinB
MANTLVKEFLKALEAEASATRKCLERIPENLFAWKPHEKSMKMGYLASVVSDVPNWIARMAEGDEIDFAKWEKFEAKTTAQLVAHFDEALKKAKVVLSKVADEDLAGDFHLKNNGVILFTSPKIDSISSSIRHSVHHRGQLTVFMRLKDIPVPSIYGPSADEKHF